MGTPERARRDQPARSTAVFSAQALGTPGVRRAPQSEGAGCAAPTHSRNWTDRANLLSQPALVVEMLSGGMGAAPCHATQSTMPIIAGSVGTLQDEAS